MSRNKAIALIREQVANFRPVGESLLVPGLLYRSGSLTALDEAGWTAMSELGIRTVIDLRGPLEITAMPVSPAPGIIRISIPIPADDDAPVSNIADEGETITRITRAYRRIVGSHGQAIAETITTLADTRRLPAIICCTAGKDRTGIVAAMLLLALGFPRHSVEADYVATNAAMHAQHRQTIIAMANRISTFAMPKGGAANAMLRADPAYLAAALDAAGDPFRYLEQFDVSPATLRALTRQLVP